ncbi:type II toxin-antitoxin system RelE/ParE family toxin [Longimicrobium sp.]|uniref:type II toxin-antitoxin system RelE/ParE family toxin n=1 Tax=Longimicrobium sp. TaxID=2029185 RepID=UPI003B3B27AE
MARSLTWTDSALDDLAELGSNLDRSSRAYSVTLIQTFAEQAERVALFPLSGRVVPEWQDVAFREIIVRRRYRLIYQVEPERVLIVAVQDTRRVLPKWH